MIKIKTPKSRSSSMNSIHSFNIQKNERLSNLVECVRQVSDFRIERCKKHHLVSVIVIAICATLGGANNMVSIAQFGEDHLEWFDQFLDLESGIPSHDTFSRVFEQINPSKKRLSKPDVEIISRNIFRSLPINWLC